MSKESPKKHPHEEFLVQKLYRATFEPKEPSSALKEGSSWTYCEVQPPIHQHSSARLGEGAPDVGGQRDLPEWIQGSELCSWARQLMSDRQT